MRKYLSREMTIGLAAVLIGCGSTATDPVDSGVDVYTPPPDDTGPPVDGTSPDSGPMRPISMLPPLQKPDRATAADFACQPTEPAGTGQMVSVRFVLEDFQTDDPVRRAQVWFFADNTLRDVCNAPECQLITTDMNAEAMVMARGGQWYAYVVQPPPGGTWAYSVQYNEPAPSSSGGSITGNSVSASTLNTIPALLGIRREPGLVTLAGTLYDCAGDPIRGAIVRAYNGATEIVEGDRNEDPHYRYFDESLGLPAPPDPVTGIGLYTDIDGLYTIINVPVPSPTTDPIRIEAWGRRNPGDNFDSLLGCEAVQVIADGITIVNVAPLRSDYPVGHPCHGRS